MQRLHSLGGPRLAPNIWRESNNSAICGSANDCSKQHVQKGGTFGTPSQVPKCPRLALMTTLNYNGQNYEAVAFLAAVMGNVPDSEQTWLYEEPPT